ncbi:MAG: hypothetical protein ACKPBU_02945 [Alphaproteobacteria bacterium]
MRVRSMAKRFIFPAIVALSLTTAHVSQAACLASNTRLCLLNGRFSASLKWNDGSGQKDAFVAGPKTDGASSAAGLFYFYSSDSNNWEILAKMIDGCGTNNHFWVLVAASTGFGWELSVKDETNGVTKTFSHPLNGQASGIADFEAFSTCGSTPPPSPTPVPGGDLAGLIGTWKFSYTLATTTFTDTFRLQEVDNSQEYPILLGLDAFNSQVGVVNVKDVSPSSTIPYTYFLLNPGSIICENFFFNRTSTTTVSGIYFQTYPSGGTCGTTFLNTYNMNGVRTSTSADPLTGSPLEVPGDPVRLETAKQLLVEPSANGGVPSELASQFADVIRRSGK